MLVQTSFKSQAGIYNFAQSGGAVGVYNLGVHLPVRAQLLGFWVTALNLLTSAGLATISFGTHTSDLLVPVNVLNNLMVVNPFGAFSAQPLQGVDLQATPLRLLNNVDVIMSIGTAALTGGQLEFIIQYQEIIK